MLNDDHNMTPILSQDDQRGSQDDPVAISAQTYSQPIAYSRMNRVTYGDVRVVRESGALAQQDETPPSPIAEAGSLLASTTTVVETAHPTTSTTTMATETFAPCFYVDFHHGGHHTRIEIGGVGCVAFLIALLLLVTGA